MLLKKLKASNMNKVSWMKNFNWFCSNKISWMFHRNQILKAAATQFLSATALYTVQSKISRLCLCAKQHAILDLHNGEIRFHQVYCAVALPKNLLFMMFCAVENPQSFETFFLFSMRLLFQSIHCFWNRTKTK